MCEVVNIQTVEGVEVIEGREFTVKKVTTICKNCGSDKISSEGYKKHTGYTCWNCEVSFDNSNKENNKRNQVRKQERNTVSIEERAENIDIEKDEAYFSMDEKLHDIEMMLLVEQLPITEAECRRLKLFLKLGSFKAVADIEGVDEKAVRLSFVSIRTRLECTGQDRDFIKDIIF